ncbi:hypothetical protein L6452_15040 [Arctium lappa]|uniref:Uncharacterized protein n=1 Tax=Arctium lappa TaxID=4217 RepID=A0ACB9CMJ1_ARCLA|nr:hypothetical protein L6452_15040 [Arctium lappa]
MLLSMVSTARVNTTQSINAAYVIKNSHGRMTAGWTEDYGKLGDNNRRYSEDILLINQPQGIDPNSREVEFVLKESILQD